MSSGLLQLNNSAQLICYRLLLSIIPHDVYHANLSPGTPTSPVLVPAPAHPRAHVSLPQRRVISRLFIYLSFVLLSPPSANHSSYRSGGPGREPAKGHRGMTVCASVRTSSGERGVCFGSIQSRLAVCWTYHLVLEHVPKDCDNDCAILPMHVKIECEGPKFLQGSVSGCQAC